jgi:hypothetical protein
MKEFDHDVIDDSEKMLCEVAQRLSIIDPIELFKIKEKGESISYELVMNLKLPVGLFLRYRKQILTLAHAECLFLKSKRYKKFEKIINIIFIYLTQKP